MRDTSVPPSRGRRDRWTQLPGGYWDPAGTVHREVELTPLTGREEELLAGAAPAPAATARRWSTTVLSRCARRVGGIAPVPPR